MTGGIVLAIALLIVLAPSARARVSLATVPPHGRPPFDLPNRTHFSIADHLRFQRQSDEGRTLPLWSGSATYKGVTYPYQMVGTTPFVHHHGNPRTVIDVPVISAVLHFPDGTTSDATKPTGCGESTTRSPRDLVAGSPIFQDHDYSIGGKFVGHGQYVDEFQRANFWQAIQQAHNKPYEVRLEPSFITVTLSADQTAAFRPITFPAACGHSWYLDAFALDNYVQTLIPSLHIAPTSFPIFLGSNITGYLGPSTNPVPVAAGNHGSYTNSDGLLQTYAEVDYDTTGFGWPDVDTLAHEVGEWMDDPLNDNHTPPITGAGCHATPPAPPNGLEVGDPLDNGPHFVTVGPMPNGVTYHPQELVFASWFFNEVPSRAVNPAWYSSNGSFLNDAADTPSCFLLGGPQGDIFATTFKRCTTLHIGYNRFVNGTSVRWRVTTNGVGTVASGQFSAIGGGVLGSKTYHFLDIALGTTLPSEASGIQSHVLFTWANGGRFSATRDPGC